MTRISPDGVVLVASDGPAPFGAQAFSRRLPIRSDESSIAIARILGTARVPVLPRLVCTREGCERTRPANQPCCERCTRGELIRAGKAKAKKERSVQAKRFNEWFSKIMKTRGPEIRAMAKTRV